MIRLIVYAILIAFVVSLAMSAADAQGTSEAIAKCGNDALRFCAPEIASYRVGTVGYCLARHHREIAVSCREFMDDHPLHKGKR